MVEGSKQVRVDNWGIFFLQRLQIFFSKTDYCDLTLQFEGNVQLKVHRLVMNACTEYFTYLEQTCPALEEGTIMMPPDLQSDVIVPIVNFMYTGMLEFHLSIFDKLYKAAEIMNIGVLTKLLDAQKKPEVRGNKRKLDDLITSSVSVRTASKGSSSTDLPPTLPGRKLPVWKRKNVPLSHQSSQSDYQDKWSGDPLFIQDARPKPTRFEWPDEELPPLVLMDSTFEEISYTSKPLLTQEEENRAISNTASTSTSMEDTRQASPNHSKKNLTKSFTEHSKETKTKTKSEPSGYEEVILFGGEEYADMGQKRKIDIKNAKPVSKKSKSGDKENKEATISVKSHSSDLDHTKIVSEILKKYPNLVKKNKNIKLKIMPVSTPTKKTTAEKPIPGFNEIKRKIVKPDSSTPVVKHKMQLRPKKTKEKSNQEGPWICDKCEGSPLEFVLYYLYRKHMTDFHNEVFDMRLCKYCGQKCSKPNLMMYHLYTKHGLRPPAIYVFPKCDQCPYIGLSDKKLIMHKERHQPNEMQCVDCRLAFSDETTLTSHVQITGHLSRSSKSTFDCQYCTKKLQSAINLFSHIKNTHFKDAKRDGIVGLDESDEIDENDDDEESEEEYSLPEFLNESDIPKDKVKIISNVKVPSRGDQVTSHNEQELVPLVQTAEADSLNNVTSNIATSLGLVDIVVLDENQQYILQENQEQTEFILPELSTGDNHFGAQVITTQHSNVIPQGVLQASGTDITSTDELVMVLTDHDYQEEHEGENSDNSNIVVLYSHPVDGQQGQFITSQGNLLVNSQTGMLELRNGTTITTTASNQIVVNSNDDDTPIESIEMIQKEIESHQELKQEPYYEEQKQSSINQAHSKQIINENMNLEPLTSDQVIINEFSEHEHHDDIASVNTDENKTYKDQSEINQTAEQNPEIYLTHDDTPNTTDQHTKTETKEISKQVDGNEHVEQMATNTETISDNTMKNAVENASIKEVPVSKDSGNDSNVQDSTDGTLEPMEIEEIHTSENKTTNDRPELMEIQSMEESLETKQEDESKLSTTEGSNVENPSIVEHANLSPESVKITCQNIDVLSETVKIVDIPSESVNVPAGSVDITPEDVYVPREVLDEPSEGVDVPSEDVDIPSEDVNVPPEELVLPEHVDVPPQQFDVPPKNVDTPREGVDVTPDGVDVPPKVVKVTPEGKDVPTEDVDMPLEVVVESSEGVEVQPEGNNLSEGKDEPRHEEHQETDGKQKSTSAQNDNMSEFLEETKDEEMEVDSPVMTRALDETDNLTITSQDIETPESQKSTEDVVNLDIAQKEQLVEDDSARQESSDTPVSKQDDEEDSQFIEKEDENSQVSESATKSQSTTKNKSNINREILEDWEEDTDSQQSEQQNSIKNNNRTEESESDNSKDEQRQAAVDRLMNDWEDDEDEEKRD